MFPRPTSGLATLLSRRDRTRLHDRGVAWRGSVDSPVGLLLAVGHDLLTFLPVFGDFELQVAQWALLLSSSNRRYNCNPNNLERF